MTSRQLVFLAINIIGGILVIGSYIWSIRAHGSADAFWGGVPASLRKYYGISMLIAAVSYIAMTLIVLLKVDDGTAKIFGLFDYRLFWLLYTVILGASALWMPLTYLVLGSPGNAALVVAVKGVLVVVALGALGLGVSLTGLRPQPAGSMHALSVVGSGLFFLHTFVLDAILWAHYWGR